MMYHISADRRRAIISLLRVYLLALCLSIGLPVGFLQAAASSLPVPADSLPAFTDNDSQASLLSAARAHREYLMELPANHSSMINGIAYPRHWLVASMDEFITLLEHATCSEQFSKDLVERFEIYQAEGRRSGLGNTMLVTGYFEPQIPGSIKKTAQYRFPIYSLPSSLITREESATGKTVVGRVGRNGAFLPFWTRAEIAGSNVLAGSELVYLNDPLSAFFLQIQGSGRIEFPDGSIRSVRFSGHNGHAYRSIGKLLVDEGKLELRHSSTPHIKQYLLDHPAEQRRILHHNPRVIFFEWGDDGPPKGNLGLPLTAGRSVAIDQSLLPNGVFYWLSSTLPIIDDNGKVVAWMPDSRFVLPQDSGSAIVGPGRVDLFMGSGHYAKHAAGSMRQPGKLYFFIKKGYSPN